MPIIIAVCLIAMLLAAGLQYLLCRRTKKWFLRVIPATVTVLVTAAVALVRYFGWSREHDGANAPIETLIFVPGLPALLVLLGLLVGWRLWRRRWRPRVVNDK